MTRILNRLWWFIKIIIIVVAIIWLGNQQGQVSLNWLSAAQPFALDISLPALLVGTALLALLIIALTRLYEAVTRLPQEYKRRMTEAKLRQGYEALTQGLIAIAAGDAETAGKLAQRAAEKLEQPSLGWLISAQAAQLQGDEGAAGRFFAQLASDPKTGFLGIRGQLMNEMQTALASGNTDNAQRLAAEAELQQPKSAWVLQARFALAARAREWRQADAILQRAIKLDAFTKDEGKHLHAALLLCQSHDAADKNQARSLSHRAVDSAPGFVPAVVAYAESLATTGRRSQAADVISRAWRLAAHPHLADAWRRLSKSADAAIQLKWFDKLLLLNEQDAEAQLARAQMLLAAQQWEPARDTLLKLQHSHPDERVFTLLAQLERDEHHDITAASNWLLQAEAARPAPTWVCKDCDTTHSVWQPLCDSCGNFASQRWHRPVHARNVVKAITATV